MTVSTEVDHNEYTGNGVTTSFPYTFRIFHKSDLVVQVVDINDNITDLVLDTDYTVTGAGGYTGGNVILTTALENGFRISIARELPVTQETDLRNQGKFFAEVHEDAFDKLTMLIQQAISWMRLSLRKPSFVANYYDALNNYIRNLRDPSRPQDAATKNYVDNLSVTNSNRAIRVPEPFISSLPDIDGRKNKSLSFDNAGEPLLLDPAQSGLWGYVLIDSFQLGANITTRFQALHWSLPDGNGEYYRWDGALPKIVDAGSTPSTTGGVGSGAWLSVGDATLRSELASENGFSLIGAGQTTLDKNIFWGTPEQYGGGLGGDDTLAIATCLANHRLMVLSDKTYNASSVVVGPDNSVWGLGKTKSVIKASANPGFFFSVKGASGVGYSGEISGICVDGNRIADWTGYFGGDSTATVSKASIRNCAFRNGTKANVVLDAAQNSLFQDLDVANDVDFEGLRGVYFVNGAGNNMLLNLECSGGSIGSIVTGRDSGFPCWGLNAFSRTNTNNTFSRCIGESISENAVLVNRKRSVLLEYANSNTFAECDLVSHGTYSECAVHITDTCSYNTFDNASFGNNPASSIPAVINEGFNTRIFGGNMDGFGSPEITTTQGIMVRDCRNLAAGYVKVQNLAGNTNSNIQGNVLYSDTSGNTVPTFNNPNQLVTDNDGRYWATRGSSWSESVQFFTGYQRTFNSALTISSGSGNVGLQLPGFGVFEIEFAVKDTADGSHRAAGKIRVVFHVGVQSLTSATVISPLVATDGQFNTLAASVDSSGFLTISINTSSVTSAFARINVRMVNDMGF